jgi:hypothetical protein
MLPTDELRAIRTTVEEYLPDVVTVLAPVETADTGGGVDVTYTAAWSGSGRASPMMNDERAFAEVVKAVATAMVTLPASCPITERCRVVVAGITYEVVAVSTTHSIQLHTRVAVVRAR